MARHPKYGKDDPERFIDGALDGGKDSPNHLTGYQDTMTSNEMVEHHVDRRDQKILTATALDNVGVVYGRFETSIKDMEGIHGNAENLEHSLKGATAVQEEVGAAGPVKHFVIPNH